MPTHLFIDKATARLAVWTGGQDLGPALSPKSYPSRVKMNTALDMIGFIKARRSGTLSIVSRTWTAPVKMFDHGLGYTPILWGWITVGGVNMPVRGSILANEINGAVVSYSVAANNTSVWIQRMTVNSASSTPANYSVSIPYFMVLSNYGVNASGAAVKPTYYNGVDINTAGPTPYTKAGYFDTLQYDYPYVSSAGNMILTRGRTMSFGVGYRLGTSSTKALGYRYSVAGHSINSPLTNGYDAAFQAAYSRVQI